MIEILDETGVVLHRVDADSLERQNLANTYLRKANLSRVNLCGANLRDANLKDADLSFAVLRGAKLEGACLDGADLRFADLSSASLEGTAFDRARLTGANLSRTWIDNNSRKSRIGGLFEVNLTETRLPCTGAACGGFKSGICQRDARCHGQKETSKKASRPPFRIEPMA